MPQCLQCTLKQEAAEIVGPQCSICYLRWIMKLGSHLRSNYSLQVYSHPGLQGMLGERRAWTTKKHIELEGWKLEFRKKTHDRKANFFHKHCLLILGLALAKIFWFYQNCIYLMWYRGLYLAVFIHWSIVSFLFFAPTTV